MSRDVRTGISITVAILALTLLPASALGATATATGEIEGGGLALTSLAAPTFAVTLDGTDQVAGYELPATVTDARGNSAGWNATITSTPFTASGPTASTLPADASAITQVSSGCASGSTCTPVANSVTYPLAVPAGEAPPIPVKYLSSGPSTGKGRFTTAAAVLVAVPATADSGSYSSTLTLGVVSGP